MRALSWLGLALLAGCLEPAPHDPLEIPPFVVEQTLQGVAWVHVSFPLMPEAEGQPNVLVEVHWNGGAGEESTYSLVDRAVSGPGYQNLTSVGPGLVGTAASRTSATLAVSLAGQGQSQRIPLPVDYGESTNLSSANGSHVAKASSYFLDRTQAAVAQSNAFGHLLFMTETAGDAQVLVRIEARGVSPNLAMGGMEDTFVYRHEDLSGDAGIKVIGPHVGVGLEGTFELGGPGRLTALAFRPWNQMGGETVPASMPSRASMQRPDGTGMVLDETTSVIDWSLAHGPWTFSIDSSASETQFDRPVVFGLSWDPYQGRRVGPLV